MRASKTVEPTGDDGLPADGDTATTQPAGGGEVRQTKPMIHLLQMVR
jgi:hypothetical protein